MCCSGAERCACTYATSVVEYSLKAEQEPLHSNNSSCDKLLSESYFNHCTYPYVGSRVRTPTSATKIQNKTIYVWMRTDQCCSPQSAVGDVTCQMYSGCFYTNIKLCPFCPQLADTTISCSLIDRNFIGLQFGESNLITNLISTAKLARVRVLSGRVRRQEEVLQRFPGEFQLVSLTPDPQSALALCTNKQTRSSFPTHLPEKTSSLKIHSRLKVCTDTFEPGSHH